MSDSRLIIDSDDRHSIPIGMGSPVMNYTIYVKTMTCVGRSRLQTTYFGRDMSLAFIYI